MCAVLSHFILIDFVVANAEIKTKTKAIRLQHCLNSRHQSKWNGLYSTMSSSKYQVLVLSSEKKVIVCVLEL